MSRLERILHDLWLKEFVWESIEVFAPIYDLISEMMALHGLVFVKSETEWRLVMSEDAGSTDRLKNALALWMKNDC